MRAPHNRESIFNIQTRLREIVGKIEALIQLIDDHDVKETLNIQYQKDLMRAMQTLESWSSDAFLQLQKVLEARGLYTSGGSEIANKPGRVFPKKPTQKKKKP